MGSKLSLLCSKKQAKKEKPPEYSPKTAQAMDNDRRNGKLIYPPLSSIGNEEPKRSVLPDGRRLYERTHIDSQDNETNYKHDDDKYESGSYFGHYNRQYDDGTFTVLSREPIHSYHIFRI